MGYDCFSLPDHLARVEGGKPVALPDPITLLARLAADTCTIRLGTMTLLDALRHPAQTVRCAATLQQISGGRFRTGAGSRLASHDLAILGGDVHSRLQTLHRTLNLVRHAWPAGTPAAAATLGADTEARTAVAAKHRGRPCADAGRGRRGPQMLRLAAATADVIALTVPTWHRLDGTRPDRRVRRRPGRHRAPGSASRSGRHRCSTCRSASCPRRSHPIRRRLVDPGKALRLRPPTPCSAGSPPGPLPERVHPGSGDPGTPGHISCCRCVPGCVMTSVIVLCGGRGTRMGPLNQDRQKCLSPIWGTPLLELILTLLCPPCLTPRIPVILLTGYLSDQVADLAQQWRTRVDPRHPGCCRTRPGWVGVEHAAPGAVRTDPGRGRQRPAQSHHSCCPAVGAVPGAAHGLFAVGSPHWRTTNHHTMTIDQGTVISWHPRPGPCRPLMKWWTPYLLTRSVLDLMRARQISHTQALAHACPGGGARFLLGHRRLAARRDAGRPTRCPRPKGSSVPIPTVIRPVRTSATARALSPARSPHT